MTWPSSACNQSRYTHFHAVLVLLLGQAKDKAAHVGHILLHIPSEWWQKATGV